VALKPLGETVREGEWRFSKKLPQGINAEKTQTKLTVTSNGIAANWTWRGKGVGARSTLGLQADEREVGKGPLYWED